MKTPYLIGVLDCRAKLSKFTRISRPVFNITVFSRMDDMIDYLRSAHDIDESKAAEIRGALSEKERNVWNNSFIAFTSPDVFELCHATRYGRRINSLAAEKVAQWISLVCGRRVNSYDFTNKVNNMDGLQRAVFETNFDDLSGSVVTEPSDVD